ncbi:MAG: 3-hydroxyacyl-[acyl-carrier-protein] dehydratase FabA, partial [Myxococcota bacterium]
WRQTLGVERGWMGDDLYGSLIERFVRLVVVTDPEGFRALRGRSTLFLGNHEVQIESLLVTAIASYLIDGIVVTMANAKHAKGWVGWLVDRMFSYPGSADPENIVYFDQSDPAQMFTLIEDFKRDVRARGASVMVHAPGTRAVRAGQQVERVSSALLDMAMELEMPIVPVHFSGGLPAEGVQAGKLEFPYEQGQQDYVFGAPLWPEDLLKMPYAERRDAVLDAINALGPVPQEARPLPGRPELAAEIDVLHKDMGAGAVEATLFHLLATWRHAGADTAQLLEGARSSALEVEDDERGQWLAEFAKRIFGPRGPRVQVKADGHTQDDLW